MLRREFGAAVGYARSSAASADSSVLTFNQFQNRNCHNAISGENILSGLKKMQPARPVN